MIMKKILAMMMLAAVTCVNAQQQHEGKNVLFGIGEPLVLTGITADKSSASFSATEYILDAMNFGAIRAWMHQTEILRSPSEANSDKVRQYTDALNMYAGLGMEITGLSHRWFIVGKDGKLLQSDGRMYRRDTTEGSLYIKSLQAIEEGWRTMVALFPQVVQWEVGNEWNTSDFLNVYPEDDTPLTDEERMEIATDMMYYAYRGIKSGNPKASVVSFSPAIAMSSFAGKDGHERMVPFTNAGYGIALALSRVYANIASGQYPAGLAPDKDPDHYFDMVAWHPYLLTGMNPMIISETYPAQGRFFREEHVDALWQNFNDMAYNVMVMNGDADKKVLLTEMGFNDWHNTDKEQAHLAEYERLFAMVSETMPYVKTVHLFRLLTAPAEYQFGLFWHGMKEYNDWLTKSNFKDIVAPYTEVYPDFSPREKAYTIQKITGGNKPLELPNEIRSRIH